MTYIHKDTCRICKGLDLTRILSLGEHPPVDAFILEEDIAKEKRYPLDVYFCTNCNLVQLLDVVAEDVLFNDQYAYFSSASGPLVEHFRQFADVLSEKILQKDDLVVDIGSNDGVMLQFLTAGHRVLGVEPSANVAMIARKKGIETMNGFFTEEMAQNIVAIHGRAKVISASNVFAHIDDIDEIMRAVKVLLAEDGAFVSESHYLLDLINKGEFDTVYHEHVCYYSIKPLIHLFQRFDMEIYDVERVSTHGGSIRVYARPVSSGPKQNDRIQELLELEESAGLHTIEGFSHLQDDANRTRDELVQYIRGYGKEGKKVIAYGAPAKGNTLLNFCGFTHEDISYITDTTPYKIGRRAPGSHIPVVSPEILKTETPDYVLLLAWNYRDYILEKERDVRERGAKFIIPIPHVEII